VLENRPERSEVVVVTNRPYDDPYDLRGEVAFVEAPRGAGLLECFIAGLAVSRAEVVHLLAAGCEATPGWADAALARFDEPDVAAVAPLVVDRDRPQRILSAGLRYTTAGGICHIGTGSSLDGFTPNERLLCGPELTSAFYRRDALQNVRSLPHYGSPAAAAVELALALRSAGYRCIQQPQCVTAATAALLKVYGGWRQGVAGEHLFRRWTTGPEGKRSWLAHAAMVAGEGLLIPLRPRLLGRLAGRFWAALGFAVPRELSVSSPAAGHAQDTPARPPQFLAADSRAA
jgi:hypothetical protein